MSVFTPFKEKKEPSKIHSSNYIRTENKPDEDTKPAEPVNPDKPEAE